MAGIYVHIPFCKKACNYCDFHFSVNLKNKKELINALCKEIELRKVFLKEPVQTIYFGGGTPSLLINEDLKVILEAITQNFDTARVTEITIECNPDDLTEKKILELKQLGFNRLSVGVQSFLNEELQWMNRAHNASESERCVKLAQDKGFENISIDLIYGSKFQTDKNWAETLQKALSLNIQHISAYNLTIEKGTKLGNDFKKKTEPLVDEEKSAKQFLFMSDMLQQAGFLHYEISNFAKNGFISKHNTAYWKNLPYLGIGPSAHSYNLLLRQWNIRSNAAYINAINSNESFFETEMLTNNQKYNEYILTGIRTMWGCNLDYIKKAFGNQYFQNTLRTINKYSQWIVLNDNTIILNKEGKLRADFIAAEMFI